MEVLPGVSPDRAVRADVSGPNGFASLSDWDGIDEPFDTLEVFPVVRVDRRSCSKGGCRNREAW